jgi:hypothetical protein
MCDTIVDPAAIKSAVQLAGRAPSLHNTQPWRWVLDGRVLQLFVDPNRAPVHTDKTGRETLIGCGAVLDHFRVAMAVAGWKSNVDRFPNPNNLHHLASIDFSPMDFVTDGHRRRADAILLRRTDRLPFSAPMNWESIENQLRATVRDDYVRLDVVPDELHQQLAEASELTDSFRQYDSSYHAELTHWTTDFELSTGIPRSSLISAAESDRVAVGRHFPVTDNAERRSEIAEDRAKVVVLSTYEDAHGSMLRCGEMLSATLLDATMAELATCTLTHITEVPASRQILADLIGQSATPHVLIRIGRVPSTENLAPQTPRRPIDEVLVIRSEGQA